MRRPLVAAPVHFPIAFSLVLAGLALPNAAHAAPPETTSAQASTEVSSASPPPSPSSDDTGEKAVLASTPATRRSGFTLGVMTGLSFGTVSGYPNDLSKIDEPAFRSATSGVGNGFTLYLGGALTDWFTFGFGMTQTSFGSDKLVTKGGAFIFHLEAFPLFAKGGLYRDLGLFANFGTGTATLSRREGGQEFAASGSLSIAGVGALWETWRFWHIALGPFAQVQYEASNSMERTLGEVGIRGTFYGGP